MIDLGPFRLEAPLGRGGMGQVWSGVHRRFGYPVAVKFLTAKSVQKSGFLEAFRNEVRMIAGLDHPNVVQVYDYGEADARTAAATGGRIPMGTPWLAMELVTGGTLAPLGGKLEWNELEPIARSLLHALGHAHARGVIHRDLKPGNVLVAPRPGTPAPSRLERPPGGYGALEVKLTDFGLASIVEAQETVDAGPFAGGTPAYMAPEQFESRWRDYGPWTDLYGVGCLLWSMVKGLPPFGTTTTVDEKRHQHLHEAPPALDPPVAVPEGFEGWLRTLLEKDPARRFRRAADALSALRALGPPITRPTSTPSLPPSAVPTLVFGEQPTQLEHTTEPSGPGRATGSHLAIAATGPHVPPVPPEWRGTDDVPPRQSLPSSGLGLFGLRTPPLVDRNGEREALWQALRRTDREGRVRAAVLTGPGGSGKSRLAEWLCQRAHETGAAQVLKATHSPIPGPTHGLGPMLRATLRCQGLARAQIRDRVEDIFASRGVGRADEWEALTEVIEPSSAEAPAAIRFTTATERYVTIRRLLQAMTLERPIVLWLDDVHHGLDALRFAIYLLDYAPRQPLPVLLVLTATDELLHKRKDEANVLAELLEHEQTVKVPVGPLPETHRSALVRGVLGLDPGLARRVEDRTHGNPLFVVQLVGDWVQRGLLRVGAEGFELDDEQELPRDVSGMWAERVARMLARRTDEEGHALELAAVLGSEVDPAEWGAACLLAPSAAHPSDALLNDLLDQRLVRCGPDGPASGWAFSHETLRTALLARADQGGRLSSWHRACAELLEGEAPRRAKVAGSGWTERVGRHWLGAGQPERSLPWLQEGARERVSTGDYAVAEQLVALRDEALRAVGAPASDERWGEGHLARYELASRRGDWDGADRILRELEGLATDHRWDALRGRARCHLADRDRIRGHHARAITTLAEVEADAVRRGDRVLVATSRLELGECVMATGDLQGALRWGRLALQEAETQDDRMIVADAWMLMGECTQELGDHAEAARLLRNAETLYEQAGRRWKVADALNSQGDVARARGELDQAVVLYRKARGLLKAIGSRSWVFPEYNTALVHLARNDFDRAIPILEVAMHTFIDQGNRNALANAHLALACCHGATHSWLLFDEHVEQASELLRAGFADEDMARLAARAGDEAAVADQPVRAANAWSLGVSLWTTLGREREADELRARRARGDR